jgi:stage IV sporulation protein FB
MKKNIYSDQMKDKSFFDLKNIIENKGDFAEDEVFAAKMELEDRGHFDHKTNDQIEIRDEVDIEFRTNDFPKKPEEEVESNSIYKSFISMAIFVLLFYVIFKWNILYILVLAGVVLIHEAGHFLAMKVFKYKDLNIFFIPLVGAFASGSKNIISQKQNVIVLLAGPVPGVIAGLILYYFGLRDQSEFLIRTSNIFIFLNLFNLLPIMPLDGGKLIKCMFFESNLLINNIFLFISIAILTYIAINSQSYFLLIVPFFLVMQLNNQSQLTKIRVQLIKKGIDLDKSFEELSDEEYWLIRDEIALKNKYFSTIISPKKYFITSSENKIIKHVKLIIQKRPIKDIRLTGKILITLFWLMTFLTPIIIIAIYYIRLGIKLN